MWLVCYFRTAIAHNPSLWSPREPPPKPVILLLSAQVNHSTLILLPHLHPIPRHFPQVRALFRMTNKSAFGRTMGVGRALIPRLVSELELPGGTAGERGWSPSSGGSAARLCLSGLEALALSRRTLGVPQIYFCLPGTRLELAHRPRAIGATATSSSVSPVRERPLPP